MGNLLPKGCLGLGSPLILNELNLAKKEKILEKQIIVFSTLLVKFDVDQDLTYALILGKWSSFRPQ